VKYKDVQNPVILRQLPSGCLKLDAQGVLSK